MDTQAFIALIGPAAQASARKTGVPASFTVAQAALESGWGESLLARQGEKPVRREGGSLGVRRGVDVQHP